MSLYEIVFIEKNKKLYKLYKNKIEKTIYIYEVLIIYKVLTSFINSINCASFFILRVVTIF